MIKILTMRFLVSSLVLFGWNVYVALAATNTTTNDAVLVASSSARLSD
jgi:hypothetical protein